MLLFKDFHAHNLALITKHPPCKRESDTETQTVKAKARVERICTCK